MFLGLLLLSSVTAFAGGKSVACGVSYLTKDFFDVTVLSLGPDQTLNSEHLLEKFEVSLFRANGSIDLIIKNEKLEPVAGIGFEEALIDDPQFQGKIFLDNKTYLNDGIKFAISCRVL